MSPLEEHVALAAGANLWLVVALVALGIAAMRAAGPLLLGSRELPEAARRRLDLLAPALLAGLIATQVFGTDHGLVVDERVLGLAAAVVTLLVRGPLFVAVLVAACATALARALL